MGVRNCRDTGERGAPVRVCLIGISAFFTQSPPGVWISWSILAKTFVLLMGDLMVLKENYFGWSMSV